MIVARDTHTQNTVCLCVPGSEPLPPPLPHEDEGDGSNGPEKAQKEKGDVGVEHVTVRASMAFAAATDQHGQSLHMRQCAPRDTVWKGVTYNPARQIENESQRIDDNGRGPRHGRDKDTRHALEKLNKAPNSYKYAVLEGR